MTRMEGFAQSLGMRFLAISMVLLLPGCAALKMPKPDRGVRLDVDVPASWTSARSANQGDAATGWLRNFSDPELERLVQEAIERNRNLRAASARLKAAKQGTIIGRAGRLPSVGARLDGSYSELALRNNKGDLGSFVGSDDYRLSLNASWEPDLWGRLANLHHATTADYESELADFQGARLSLAANTVKAWCNLTAARLQVELAEQTRESFDRNLRIVERNYKAGDVTASPLDVQFARNQLASTERGLISQRLGLDEARRSLELLLGRYPSASVSGRNDLPVITNNVPAGLPSELLLRRPDLISASAGLRASAERADAARKGMLPSITLTAGGSSGIASTDLLDLIGNPSFIAWNVAGALAKPVYRGGALKAQARQSLAFNEAAVQSFSGLALRAFREVESALAAEQSLTQQYAFLETEVRQANLAEAQATRDYSEGIVGYLSVLEAQRRAFTARSAMINLRNARLQTRIDLYLALGGDFADTPPASQQLSRTHD